MAVDKMEGEMDHSFDVSSNVSLSLCCFEVGSNMNMCVYIKQIAADEVAFHQKTHQHLLELSLLSYWFSKDQKTWGDPQKDSSETICRFLFGVTNS